jgi:hypothetical protein
MDKTFLLNNILKSDGTNQSQRILPALLPDAIKIDERGIKDILDFSYQLAQSVNFFNLANVPDGDWQRSFAFVDDSGVPYTVDEIIKVMGSKSDFHPEFALFLAFVQLFGLVQNDINAITGKHLDFYYTEVLRLQKKAAIPDKVNIVLELAKNLLQYQIGAGTTFKGGKDPNTGLALTYTADNEIVVNKAQITAFKSVYIDAADNYTVWSSDAANSADGKGKPFVLPGSRWSGFGESQTGKTDPEKNMDPATIGFAFASPLLILGEGKRSINLAIGLGDTATDIIVTGDISNGVQLYLSGAKAWIQPSIFTARIIPDPDNPPLFLLQIGISLDPVDPAVVPFSSALPGPVFDTPWPVIQVVLSKGAYLYNYLYNLRIRSTSIDVAVSGVKNLVVQNSQSQLNPAKPFQPFGSQPTIGSAFYIGSAEVFQKKLSSLSLDIQWNEVPATNIGNYYLPYYDNATSLANIIFSTSISFLYKDNWVKLKNEANPGTGDYFLFNLTDATALNEITLTGNALNAALGSLVYSRNTALQQQAALDNTTHDGFISLEITGPDPAVDSSYPFKAFGHSDFPNIYAKRAIKMATNPDPSDVLPPAPYTPSIKTLSLDYTSGQVINLADGSSPEQFFHVGPFGAARLDPASPYLFPAFRDETDLPQLKVNSPLYLGNFYMGLANFVPPRNISILFQVADGSADTNTIINDEDIQWSYLAGNKWIPITPLQIISNTTDGFQTSGIISFTIGSDANADNTLMPQGTHWIRGSLEKDPAGISRLIDVRTQALEVSYALPGIADATKADAHLAIPLAPQSIKEMVVKDAAIKSIQQPYQSFDGNPGEQDTIYYTRVSERLRHKKRALTLWDYERLILDAFPSIFKVKCLTHTDEQSDLALGAVRAVVVPNLLNKNTTNPLQPTANLVTLQNIKKYVGGYTSAFVDFDVDNPVYEQLLVDFKVGFMPGKDPGYYGNLLNEEIKKFLSPWAYEEGQDITFGGKVYKSDIIVFIENRDYVDFVNDFHLYHIFDGIDNDGKGIGDMMIGTDFIIGDFIPPGLEDMTISLDFIVGDSTEVAIASGPRSILVSAPDHRVTVLKTGEYACPGIAYLGIGYMAVGGDFIVT